MALDSSKMHNYIQILKEELVPALGCTEPIAIAYTAAHVRKILGGIPDDTLIEASGNIIKNAKSVIVPNSGGMKGMAAAAVIGLTGGNVEKGLEVLADVTEDNISEAKKIISENNIKIGILNTPATLHIKITAKLKNDTCIAELMNQHTNIILLKKNDETIFSAENNKGESGKVLTDRSCLNVKDILEFAGTVDLSLVKDFLEKQIEYNTKIAKAGLTENFGISIGKNILNYYKRESGAFSIKVQAKAEVAAASDARMCGCPYPVITNSGSGNQGLAVSIPVIVYARELNKTHEQLLRALIVSNLLAIHQKTGIGRLSAYCGAVTAAAACSAAITYLKGGSYEQVCFAVTNTLATVSGMICDGAKQSCAAKIAAAVDTALFSHDLAMDNHAFASGDGIVKEDIEKTISGIGIMASKGMLETDKVVLDIMVK